MLAYFEKNSNSQDCQLVHIKKYRNLLDCFNSSFALLKNMIFEVSKQKKKHLKYLFEDDVVSGWSK